MKLKVKVKSLSKSGLFIAVNILMCTALSITPSCLIPRLLNAGLGIRLITSQSYFQAPECRTGNEPNTQSVSFPGSCMGLGMTEQKSSTCE